MDNWSTSEEKMNEEVLELLKKDAFAEGRLQDAFFGEG